MKTASLAWLALAALVAVGCGDDDDSSGTTPAAGSAGAAGANTAGSGGGGKGGSAGVGGMAGATNGGAGGTSAAGTTAAGAAGTTGGAAGSAAGGAGQGGAGMAGAGGAAGSGGMVATSEVHFLGRFDMSNPAQPSFAWPGSAIATRFEGTGLSVKLHDSGSNFFAVSVDGGAPVVLPTSKATDTYTLATGLPAGPHDVVMAKRTESFVGAVQFQQFVPDAGGKLVATPPPFSRHIEFVGDSITCGYGNEGQGPSCPFTADTENQLLAYSGLTSAALDADQHVIAYSGKGAYRDYSGATDAPMVKLYDRIFADSPGSVWDFSTWKADVVVINLGTNDFAKGDPGQPYADGYLALATKVREHNPDAFIVCVLGPSLGGDSLDKARAYIQSVIGTMTAAGDTRVSLVEVATQSPANGYGCDYHPSLKTHQLMAETLTAAIKKLTGW